MHKIWTRTEIICATILLLAMAGLVAYDKYLTTQAKKDCNAQHQ